MADEREVEFCRRPDCEFPDMVCGQTLPCPWHTVVVDIAAAPPVVIIPVPRLSRMGRHELTQLRDLAETVRARCAGE